MSTTIDQRVVEMRFDNSHFEKNVSTTMSTLDKLKAKLNLSSASKGLNSLNNAAKNVNMSGLGGAVDVVTAKFSALQVAGVTALARITNSAITAGKNIVKSLTIDPISSGFSEYETKMGSIQTILANTEHQGTTLNDVTRALEELNLYADKTIYNFQEMTRNIGTFTAAGVDLDTSVRSIQGIANLAAISGSTSQQASTAMYQLSQALATGTVKLMDWNSVVNAGMGGKVFQNALIQTAAMLDGSAAKVDEWQKTHIDKFGSFRDSLTQGEWLTSEVLTKTLEQFTMSAEKGSAEWEEFKKSLMDDGYTEAQAEGILKMANTATDAATKVKTFTQLMDTLKESAQSGWAQTWETLIGDFEEAKSFFTQLSDIFGGIIGESANRRNSWFTEVFSSNWDKLIKQINDAGIETEQFEASIRKVTGDTKLDNLIEQYGSLEAAVKKGAISSDVLKKALDGIAGTSADSKISGFVDGLKEIERTLRRGHVGEDVKKLQTALDELGYDLGAPGIDGIIGPITEKAIKEFQKANGLIADGVAGPETIAALEKAGTKVEEISGNVDDLKGSCNSLIDVITKTSGRELLLDSLLNIIKAIQRPLEAVGEAWRNTFSISPESFYKGLEKFNKFTSKFVMGGILDITKWHELTAVLDKFGISTRDLTLRLQNVLKDHGVDVGKLREEYGNIANAFNEGAISVDILKEALLGFDGITESLLTGGEAADKVRRTFEGLFAILDIIGTLTGSGLKIGFEVLSGILGHFDLDILGLTANIGDAIVAFRDWLDGVIDISGAVETILPYVEEFGKSIKEWFSGFKQTAGIQNLLDIIDDIQTAFKDFFNGDIDVSEFATNLGTNLANALKSLPEIASQVASDFIAGFTNGLDFGIFDTIGKVVTFCIEFVQAFAAALGVQSPSWKAFDIAVDFIQGFINGLGEMVGTVLSTVKDIAISIITGFRDFITDESGKIEFGKLFAGGIIVSVLWILKQFAGAVGGIVGAIDGLEDIFENTAKTIKSFKKVVDGYAWDLKAKALMKLAGAVAILAGTVWILSQIKDVGKLWNAVGVVTVLAGVLVGLAFAMSKLSDASVSVSKEGLNVKGITSGLLQIGIVIALLAVTVKMIGSMDTDEAIQGFIGLAGIAGGMYLFMKAMGKVSTYSKDVKQLGSMMIKMSIAMILLIGVCKLVNGLSPEEMGKGVIFAAAFAIFVRSITAVAKTAGNNVGKVGSMAVKLAIAMGLLVGVVKLASKLSAEEMVKGVAFATGFTLFVKALVACTKIGKNQQIAKLGGLVLSISTSLILMVGVCKLVNTLTVGEMLKGAAFVAGFALFLKALVGILKIGNEQQLAKVTGTIIGLSVAIGILAGVTALLGLLDITSLAKGLAAVGILGLLMTGMVKALKGAQNVKGAIMMMAITIGVMAAAIVALSFIDPADLTGATAALGTLMGMFTLMVKVSNKAKISLGSTTIMLGVVIALAGVLALLSSLEVGSTLEVAASIGLLMLTLGTTMQLISKAGAGATAAIGPMFALTLVAGLIGLLLTGLSKLNPGSTLEIATSISEVLLAMSASALILSKIGPFAAAGVGGAAAFLGLVLAAGAILGVIGGLVAKIPGAQKFLDSGVPIMESIGKALGSLIGGFIGGIGEGMMDSFESMIDTFGVVVDKLVDISNKGTGVNASGFDGVKELIGVLSSIAKTTVGTTLSDIFTFGGTSMEKFQTDAVAFFEAMKAISEASNGVTINEAGMSAVIGVAKELANLQSSLEPIGGVISWFKGRSDLATFGVNVGEFIGSMKTALSSLNGFIPATGALSPIISAAKELANLQSSLEPIGGMITWFGGRDDLGTFGTNVAAFIGSMKIALSSLEGTTINNAALDPIISAAQSLANLQSSLEPIGGVITWFSGRDDLGTFGINISTFIGSMKTALATLEGVVLNEEALTSVITAASKLASLQSQLEPMGGVISWFAGRTDLGTFGVNIGLFADAMGLLKMKMGETGISEEVVASISNSGNAIIALQNALPEEHWFDGKMNLSEFSDYITDFGTAMGTFAAEVTDINIEAVNTSITAAQKIRTLIETLSDLDASGVASFAGVGLGDGHLVNIGQAIGKYAEEVSGLDVAAVTTSVSAATKLRTLIAGLTGLDASGIENFKVASIGSAMKSYANKVRDIDSGLVSQSVSSANRLKTLIAGLSSLDASGVGKFKIEPIGLAMKSYGSSVKGVDIGTITSSISSANKVKSFIASLAGLDTSGVLSFKTAVSTLGTISFDSIAKAFSGSNINLSSVGAKMIESIASGMTGKQAVISSKAVAIANNTLKSFTSKIQQFSKAGSDAMNNFVKGLSSKAGNAKSVALSTANAAASAARSGYISFYNAGYYLVSGFAAGISANTYAAVARAQAMAYAAAAAARAALKIKSPSRVGYEIGDFFGLGFVNAIGDYADTAYSASTDMAESARNGLSNAISKISDVINNDIDAQPTIRPVLDLSEVRTGVNAISSMFNNDASVGVMANVGAVSSMMNRRGQNGVESEVVSAINKLRKDLSNVGNTSYTINGITYDDGSAVSDAVQSLVRATRVGRRI